MTLAIIFDSVGAGEWLLLLAVLLVVMGPKRLPGAIRTFGNHYAKFRRAAETFKRQLMEMDTEFDRAVDAAAREAEEAAKIPDVSSETPSGDETLPSGEEYPEYPESSDYSDEPEYLDEHEAPESSEAPETTEAPRAPEETAKQVTTTTDGDRAPQEP